MKNFLNHMALIGATSLVAQLLDSGLYFYDLRIVLGVVAGIYMAPHIKKFMET